MQTVTEGNARAIYLLRSRQDITATECRSKQEPITPITIIADSSEKFFHSKSSQFELFIFSKRASAVVLSV